MDMIEVWGIRVATTWREAGTFCPSWASARARSAWLFRMEMLVGKKLTSSSLKEIMPCGWLILGATANRISAAGNKEGTKKSARKANNGRSLKDFMGCSLPRSQVVLGNGLVE